MPHDLLLLAASTTTTTVKAKSSSSSSFVFLVLIILFGAFYVFYIRPRSRNRATAANKTGTALNIGDEVISAGGILGVVRNVVDDEIEVEVAPGTTLVFWRRAVNLRSAVRGAPRSTPVADDPSFEAGEDAPGADHGSLGAEHDDDSPADETGTVGHGSGWTEPGPPDEAGGRPDGDGGGH